MLLRAGTRGVEGRTPQRTRYARAAMTRGAPRVDAVGLALAAAKLAVQLLALRPYGYFRDELYYLACSDHLAWGYVDHPPLSIAVLRIWRGMFGDSLVAIRLFPALAEAAAYDRQRARRRSSPSSRRATPTRTAGPSSRTPRSSRGARSPTTRSATRKSGRSPAATAARPPSISSVPRAACRGPSHATTATGCGATATKTPAAPSSCWADHAIGSRSSSRASS